MMKTDPDPTSQSMQRVRVGMTGLASVLVLIGLGSAVFSYVSKERPVAAVGASKEAVVANMTATALGNVSGNEPLADLGVAPVATTGNSAAQ